MRAHRVFSLLLLGWLISVPSALRADLVPPSLSTAGTSTLDFRGRPWAFLAIGESRAGLGRPLAVYSKSGAADSNQPFTFRGVIAPTVDPVAIQVQLSRGVALGDNLAALEAQMIAVHRQVLSQDTASSGSANLPTLTLPQRLSGLLIRAGGDSALAQLLDVLSLAHPALRLVRGTAWAGPLSVAAGTPVTFELRERSAQNTDGAVVGRVTIIAGQGDNLPPPSPVVVVPDTSASGDLSVALRWATPDTLRHAGSRHHGDVVWRVTRSFAEAQGFQNTAPVGSKLDALAVSISADVRRLPGPVFPTKLFRPEDVADFVSDPSTRYLSDNNNRYSSGGLALPEGAQFYYFVAAADSLGRPGAASAGVLATFCRRVPPPIPSRLTVLDQWAKSIGGYWDVRWQANAPGDGTPTSSYELYRGTDLAALASAQRGQLDLTAIPIVAGHPQAMKRVASIDAPAAGASATIHWSDPEEGQPGTKWWFALRALHASPPGCPGLASAVGPPSFASVPDRSPPPSPAPEQITGPTNECLRVACMMSSPASDEIAEDALDVSSLQFTARCVSLAGIGAAHFQVTDTTDNSVVLPETVVIFSVGETNAEISWSLPLKAVAHLLNVQCWAEVSGGFLSDRASSAGAGVLPAGNHQIVHHFVAGAIANSELPAAAATNPLWQTLKPGPLPPGQWPTDLHLTVSPYSGQIFHPKLCLPLAPGAEQYRVYRRIEDGPMTLIAQGLQSYSGPGCALTIQDETSPAFNGRVAYFAQLLDEHGRPGAMRRLGAARFTGDKPPTPVLFSPQTSSFGGSSDAPTVTLTWVCPPEHVERFEIFFSTVQPAASAAPGISTLKGASSILKPQIATVPKVFKFNSTTSISKRLILPVYQSFLTGRVGGDLGPGPRFTSTMQVNPDLRYTVWLRSWGPGGEVSDTSLTIEFQWLPPAPPPATIAWPARPLPPVAGFNPGIQVVDFSTVSQNRLNWTGVGPNGEPAKPSLSPVETPVGIRVGSLTIDNDQAKRGFSSQAPNGPIFYAPSNSKTYGKADPNLQVFTRDGELAQKLFPCVLYRAQVPNATFPKVSGDVIQCSPLIRAVAWLPESQVTGVNAAQLADPYFRWIGPDGLQVPLLDLYLVDTQPVVSRARYRYWLVRFNSFVEPIQTVPCGEVEIVDAANP